MTADPTPIPITKRTRTALILAVLVLIGLVVWYVPSVLSTLIGGFALLIAIMITGLIAATPSRIARMPAPVMLSPRTRSR